METEQLTISEDTGNIVALEHVNLTVPDQTLATLFYVVGLGFTRDPYLMVGLDNMWVNVGQQQFHLPTRAPQVIPGHIGLVVSDLEALRKRLEAVAPKLVDTRFAWSETEGSITVICPWGNHFRCFPPQRQFGDLAIGIAYVEFEVAIGAAEAIARFYRQVVQAPASVTYNGDQAVASVSIGAAQTLRFRESAKPLPKYDGHHIAVYVANVSGLYGYLSQRDLLMQGVANHQFRFKTLIDPDSGAPVFELEHEVRSLHHPMYGRVFVNRNPAQSLRNYGRGNDALNPAV